MNSSRGMSRVGVLMSMLVALSCWTSVTHGLMERVDPNEVSINDGVEEVAVINDEDLLQSIESRTMGETALKDEGSLLSSESSAGSDVQTVKPEQRNDEPLSQKLLEASLNEELALDLDESKSVFGTLEICSKYKCTWKVINEYQAHVLNY
jgi:hypothetical protein